MDTTTHIRTFVEVVRCGGFSEAARQLGVVPSVVAKRIAQLEAELQARLFERTTRKVTLTEAGEGCTCARPAWWPNSRTCCTPCGATKANPKATCA